jgi:hypothetical protein
VGDSRDVIEAVGLLMILGVLIIIGNRLVQRLSARVERIVT